MLLSVYHELSAGTHLPSHLKEDEGVEDKGVGVLLPVVLTIQVLLIALRIQPLERLQPLTVLSIWFSGAEESSITFWILYACKCVELPRPCPHSAHRGVSLPQNQFTHQHQSWPSLMQQLRLPPQTTLPML